MRTARSRIHAIDIRSRDTFLAKLPFAHRVSLIALVLEEEEFTTAETRRRRRNEPEKLSRPGQASLGQQFSRM